MSAFASRTTTLRGRVKAAGKIEDVFPLFSPDGERLWVPGWDPEMLHPTTGWHQGQIFRTQEEQGEAVWVITRLDHDRHQAEYHRVEPGRYVANVDVACRTKGPGETEVTIAYSFVGLSESGNREIAEMTQEDYDAKMARWTDWVDRYLRAG